MNRLLLGYLLDRQVSLQRFQSNPRLELRVLPFSFRFHLRSI